MTLLVAGLCCAPLQAQRNRDRDESSARAQVQRAIELTRSGRFQEAIPIFVAARGQTSDNFAVSFNLALCYVATGQYPPAIGLLNEIRSSGRSSSNVENLLAQSLLGNRQPKEAFAAFERAARLAPRDEKLYVYFIESCMANGFHDLGVKAADSGLKQMPDSARLVFERALLLAQMDYVEEAMKELDRVPRLSPGSDVAYIATAQKKIFESEVDEAVRVAREGINKGKKHFMLLALFGEAVILSGADPRSPEFPEARAALEQSVSMSPNYISARISLGKLYLVEGRVNDAIQQLEVARELDPGKSAVYSNLAAAYRRRGDTARAEEMLAVLDRLNREEIERIRNAPGDRKAGYMSKPAVKKQ
jgi:tetratricopeptide (TPR) repeat protein